MIGLCHAQFKYIYREFSNIDAILYFIFYTGMTGREPDGSRVVHNFESEFGKMTLRMVPPAVNSVRTLGLRWERLMVGQIGEKIHEVDGFSIVEGGRDSFIFFLSTCCIIYGGFGQNP